MTVWGPFARGRGGRRMLVCLPMFTIEMPFVFCILVPLTLLYY